MTSRVLVAGTAGGVGTTTVTALTFALLRDAAAGAPVLLDHTAGDLGRRLPDGDEARSLDPERQWQDLGPHAWTAGADALADPAVVLVAVSAATPIGADQAGRLVHLLRGRYDPVALPRTVVVLCGGFGRLSRSGRSVFHDRVTGLRREADLAGVVVVPADSALAAGGRIPTARLHPETWRAAQRLVDLVGDRRPVPPASAWWTTPPAPDDAQSPGG